MHTYSKGQKRFWLSFTLFEIKCLSKSWSISMLISLYTLNTHTQTHCLCDDLSSLQCCEQESMLGVADKYSIQSSCSIAHQYRAYPCNAWSERFVHHHPIVSISLSEHYYLFLILWICHIKGICSGMLASSGLGTRRNCKLVFYLLWRLRVVPVPPLPPLPLTPVQTDFHQTCSGSANQNP